MNATDVALQWAKGLEAQDGVAQHVDVKEVKAEIDIDDVDKNDIHDVEDTETEPNTDGHKEVKANPAKEISQEDYDAEVVSGDAGGKTIDATNPDEATGSPKRYVISGFNADTNPAKEEGDSATQCVILMQNGVIPDVGLNGVTAEDLLKVVEEVFVCYQESKFACEENEQVLTHVRAAREAILSRLSRRAEQGTEGTHEGN